MTPTASKVKGNLKKDEVYYTTKGQSVASEGGDDAAESESTGSSIGKGSGSGGGYTADCSDLSSVDARKSSNDGCAEVEMIISELDVADKRIENTYFPHTQTSTEIKPTKEKGHKSSKRSTRTAQESLDIEAILNFATRQVCGEKSEDECPVVQVNGVRISHPMDPRIDISNVGHVLYASVPALHQSMDSSSAAQQEANLDSYLQLMEVVRPFFHQQGVNVEQGESAKIATNSEVVLSEACLSSLVTSINSNSTNALSTENSDLDRKVGSLLMSTGRGDCDQSDSSSMVVLARGKRKNDLDCKGERENESNTSTGSSTEKRVCIRESVSETRQEDDRDDKCGACHESSASEPLLAHDPLHLSVRPRIVTDTSSSSNRTDSAVSNMATSGSASGGNTGSGSNQGSSGSGNEGKCSSEELLKEDNSGDVTGASDATGSQKIANATSKPSHGKEGDKVDESKLDSSDDEDVVGQSNEAREKKLQVKKRKRIEMRREYEAQQHLESSESSNPTSDALFRPGRPVALDEVLYFSRIARIVIQAIPPFLVVHTNAAYSRLTGIDAHVVVGKPIGALMRLPEYNLSSPRPEGGQLVETRNELLALGPSENPQFASELEMPSSLERDLVAAEAAGIAYAEASQRDNARDAMLERLVAASGFGRIQLVQVVAKPSQVLANNHEFARRDAGDNALSAVYCNNESTSLITCNASIAPVISAQESLPRDGYADDYKTKRRKVQGSNDDEVPKKVAFQNDKPTHRRHHRSLITHYVIQLDPTSMTKVQANCNESVSSNPSSVEARLVGLTKESLQQQRAAIAAPSVAVRGPEFLADDEASESTETGDHVAAVG